MTDMLEKLIIENCAPTLANLKTGEIVNFKFENIEKAREEVRTLDRILESRGVNLEILKEREKSLLLYVYRKNRLQHDLSCPMARSFLEQQGYKHGKIENTVRFLKTRVNLVSRTAEFPHEIGLFLSYPIGDVLGFIENKGRNCRCCGYWKVYTEEEKAVSMFKKFDKCKDVYKKLCGQGASINKLTVAC
ncbi:MAG: DUF3793 family protein [Anaerovoracaceae bacterium]